MQTLAPSRTTRNRPIVTSFLIAIAVGGVAALAKRYLDFHLGLPGHAGVGWIGVLILGRLLNSRPGMATVAGLSMGLLAVPVGIGHSMGYNVLLYGLAGAVLDSGALLRLPLNRAWGAATAGVIVHLAKFGFTFGNAWISGIVKRVELYGFLAALRNHIVFGILGGLVAWAAWKWAWRPLNDFLNRRTPA